MRTGNVAIKNKTKRLIDVGRGITKADLVLRGGRVVNVFSGELYMADVAIADGRIAGLGSYEAKRSIDVSGRILLPGFIDSHVHIESTMLSPLQFARAALRGGVTAVVADPHEIANVLGTKGIRAMLDATEALPLDFFFMLPSCVPATVLETSGARLGVPDLMPFLDHARVLGLAELMNYPGVLSGDPDVLQKITAFSGAEIDGHAPGLSGKDLSAYAGAGISSDHECVSAEEAKEKLRSGMTIFIRQGSAAKNLLAILPAVTDRTSRFFCFATDDLQPADLMRGGMHLILKKAVRAGLDPVTAVQMATINPASHFKLRNRGAIAPGFGADIVVIDDFKNFVIEKVFKNGELVARKGKTVVPLKSASRYEPMDTVRTGRIRKEDIALRTRTGHARVIELIPDQIETRQRIVPVFVDDAGMVANDRDRDIAKLVVVERHKASGRIGVGLVKGFGMTSGALASTVAHDSHNIVAVGVYDEDILAAIEAIRKMQGGLVAVRRQKVLAALPLPIAGLMSDKAAEIVVRQQTTLGNAVKKLGIKLRSPFAALSFLALPVVPELKLTDQGLVDVRKSAIVDLFV